MIKFLRNDEKYDALSLYRQCFDDTEEETAFYFDNLLKDNIVVVEKDNWKIVSMVHVSPRSFIINGRKNEINYLYAIGTDREYRKKGCMRNIMNNILNTMAYEHQIFAYLIPSDDKIHELYEKFGFSYVRDIPGEKPEESRKRASHSLILRKAERSDFYRLSIFYGATASKLFSVYPQKSPEYYSKLYRWIQLEGGRMEIYVENRVIMGYRVWLDGRIYEEILDPEISTMSFTDTGTKPYVMARIILLSDLIPYIDIEKTAYIRLSDPVIAENNGLFELGIRDGSKYISKIDVGEGESNLYDKLSFDGDVGEFTALVFGYRKNETVPCVCCPGGFYINDYM